MINGQSAANEIAPQTFFESLLTIQFGCFYKKEPDLVRSYLEDIFGRSSKDQSDEWKAFRTNSLSQFMRDLNTVDLRNALPETFGERIDNLEKALSDLAAESDVKVYEIKKRIIEPLQELRYDRAHELGKEILDKIAEDWRDLKRGKNFHGYYKSLLMEYFCEKGVRWEKRKIKQTLLDSHPKVFGQIAKSKGTRQLRISGCDVADLSTDQYIRALLGLADHFEYRACNKGDSIKIRVRSTIKDGHDNDMIARFQAPVLFKVFDNSIYMVPLPIPILLTTRMDRSARKYEFNLEWKLGSEKGERSMFTLTVPDGFSVTDFLDTKLAKSSHPNFKADKSIAEMLGYEKRVQP